MPDPIHQFELHRIFPIQIGGWDLSFTNSAAFMLAAVLLSTFFFVLATQSRALVPRRLQSVAEIAYDFVAGMVRESMGEEGMKFFPLVFSLFMFVLTANLLGMIPGFFTVTSHVIVTFALAMLVIGTVVIYGFMKHGTHFLGLFVPSGVPGWLLPFIVVIELVSFLSRPISLSLRLFANMFAGHMLIAVFSIAAWYLVSPNIIGMFSATASFTMAIVMTAFELLIQFLQAYIFTMLVASYISQALEEAH